MSVRIDLSGVMAKIEKMKKLAITAATAQALTDMGQYVPMDTGALVGSALSNSIIEDGHIEWATPYAHYLHEGVVYGPNIPIMRGGVLYGFFSPPRKHPTGRRLRISKFPHAKATAHWTRVAKEHHVEQWRRIAEKAMGGR